MRYLQLKSNAKILQECREVISSSAFQNYILPMLIEEHPGRTNLTFVSAEHSFAIQRESSGYEKAINLLTSIMEETIPTKTPKSTYEEPNARS